MCKKWLKLAAGVLLILATLSMLPAVLSPWMIVGLYLALAGLMPMVCNCAGCMDCKMDTKKKR